MSQENVEILKRGHEGFNRGDASVPISLSTPEISLSTPDVEWGATGAFPGVESTYRGAQAIREWMDVMRSAWEEFEVSLGEVLHDEGDLLVVTELIRGRGRSSGAEVEMRIFAVYRLEDGRIRSRQAFTERTEALEAAGLSE